MRILVSAAAIALLGSLAPSASFADSPRDFIATAIEGDNSEIMLGRMAARRGGSEGVRHYGQTLEQDHSKAREQAVDVAQRLGVKPSDQPSGEARRERDRLRDMYGQDFDREFVNYMINDHRKDIGDFRKAAHEHHGPAGQMAEAQLPTLQKHLDMALSLRGSVRSTHGDKGWAANHGHGRGGPANRDSR